MNNNDNSLPENVKQQPKKIKQRGVTCRYIQLEKDTNGPIRPRNNKHTTEHSIL